MAYQDGKGIRMESFFFWKFLHPSWDPYITQCCRLIINDDYVDDDEDDKDDHYNGNCCNR